MSEQFEQEIAVKVGAKIQQRRKEIKMTAAELAEKLELSQQQMSRYERGTSKVTVAQLIQMALVLETPIQWFLMDCEQVPLNNLKESPPKRYSYQRSEVLKYRLDQQWEQLSETQQEALVSMVDAFKV